MGLDFSDKVFDIVITNALLLQLNDEFCLSSGNYVLIDGGDIVAIGKMTDFPSDIKTARLIDASSFLVMPGLINTHNHAAMTLFRGLADDLPLMAWLQEHIFPAEAKFVSPEMVYWCSKLAAAEMILSGTTTVADGYFFEDSAARAFLDSGLRAVAAQGIIDFPAPGVPDPTQNIKAAELFLSEWQGVSNCVRPGVFCHSPYTCGPDTIKNAKELARRQKAPFFIHVAETIFERDQSLNEHHVTPVKYLYDLGIMDSNTVFIHCVWLTDDDMFLIKEKQTKIVTCPESNMKLASGIAPLVPLLDGEIVVGLGTDGTASNNNLDMFCEMDSCAKLHKVVSKDPTVIPAQTILEMATINGARLLGLDRITGTIEVGKRADILLVNLDKPHLVPFYGPGTLVYAATGADVHTVIIDGKLIMEDREILSFDMKETIFHVRELSKSILNHS
jgi:5-methylthioadenosine/S-adenosylhomocysteine deaminase